MNNKELAIINYNSEKEIKDIDLLWDYLIKTKSDNIRNEITDLLANIFYGRRNEIKDKRQEYLVIFAKSIYDELDETIIKKGNKNEKGNVKSIQDIISLIKKIENKFYNRREIIDYIKQIGKVINLNNKRSKKEEEKEEKNFQKNMFFRKYI